MPSHSGALTAMARDERVEVPLPAEAPAAPSGAGRAHLLGVRGPGSVPPPPGAAAVRVRARRRLIDLLPRHELGRSAHASLAAAIHWSMSWTHRRT
jgi:hypothetical protein